MLSFWNENKAVFWEKNSEIHIFTLYSEEYFPDKIVGHRVKQSFGGQKLLSLSKNKEA